MAELEREAGTPALLPLTKARVERVARAFAEDAAEVERLALALVTLGRSQAPHGMLSSAADGGQAVMQCYEHLFRDWVWGAAEAREALDIVTKLVPDRVHRVAVLGAGTGRLVTDLHEVLEPDSTYGIDRNPLPLLVLTQMLEGRTVTLHEYPLAPRDADGVAVRRELRPPAVRRSGLWLALADALAPPIVPGSLDLVVTPWFVDAVDADPRVTCRAVHRLLAPGGRWVNFGPLRFTGSVSSQLTVDELLEVARDAGFDVEASDRHDVRYFDSPSSGSRRIDTVFAFAARAVREPGELRVPVLPPSWVEDPTLPVPVSATLEYERQRLAATLGVLSLVDGSRSLRAMAEELAGPWRTPVEVAEARLRELLLGLGTPT